MRKFLVIEPEDYYIIMSFKKLFIDHLLFCRFVPLTWVCNITDDLVKKEIINATGQREIMTQIDMMRESVSLQFLFIYFILETFRTGNSSSVSQCELP